LLLLLLLRRRRKLSNLLLLLSIVVFRGRCLSVFAGSLKRILIAVIVPRCVVSAV
jgi:hypothetical protein